MRFKTSTSKNYQPAGTAANHLTNKTFFAFLIAHRCDLAWTMASQHFEYSERDLEAGDTKLDLISRGQSESVCMSMWISIALRKGNRENGREANAMSDDVKKIASNDEPFGPELGRLLHPTRFFKHPRDVVQDATLTTAEKRAILSSWASDACAVESVPALRQMPGSGVVVRFDDVIDALRQLDGRPTDHGSRRPQHKRRDRGFGGDSEDGPTGSGNWL